MAAICPDECALLARQVQAYVKSVRDRLLPAIAELDEGVHEEAGRLFQELQAERRWSAEELYEAQSFAEDIMEDATDDLLFVQEHVLGLAVAGLFSFWERSMRRILLRAIRFRLPVPPAGEIEEAAAPKLIAALHASGNRMPPSGIAETLAELNLIANVIKHGSGRSLRELAALHPHRFFGGTSQPSPSPDLLVLTGEDFASFGEVIANFWRSVAIERT